MKDTPSSPFRQVRDLDGTVLTIGAKGKIVHIKGTYATTAAFVDREESKSKKPRHTKGKISQVMGNASFTNKAQPQPGWSCVIL